MTQLQLFTYLKNTDLACLTAEDAVKDLLGYTALVSLRRYQLWNIYLENADQSQLQHMLDTTYYLVNPNKEGYYLSKLPSKKIDPNQTLCLVSVFNQSNQGESNLALKISRKTQISIPKINKSILWEIVIQSNDIKTLEKQVIMSQSINQGLLVNPIFESYSFLDPTLIYETHSN